MFPAVLQLILQMTYEGLVHNMNSSNLGRNAVCLPYKLMKPGLDKKLLQLKELQFSGNNKASSQKWKFKETHSESIIRRNKFHLKIQSCRKLAWCSKCKSRVRHFSAPREQRENLDVLMTFFISQM